MTRVALGNLCEIRVGRTPARANPEFWGPGHPWLSIADMSQGLAVRQTKETITDAGAKLGTCITPGTVLLSFKLSIGKVAINEIPLFTNEAIAALPIRDTSVLDARYLLRVLQSIDLSSGSNRAAMGATLNKRSLAQVEIQLPPIEEQRRIAGILDQADALRAKRRQVLAHLDALTQSIFHDMFGGARASTTVEGIVNPAKGSIRTGPFGSQLLHSEFVSEGIAVLGLDNVVGNEFRWAQRRYITPEKYRQLARYQVHPGDVLISIMGTTGRCAVVPDDIPTAINTKHICAITLNSDLAVPEFVRASFLWHPESRDFLARQTKGSIMDGLNMSIIKAMPLPIPSLQRQREFAGRLSAVEAVSDKTRLEPLDTLFASLQSRAFRGEL